MSSSAVSEGADAPGGGQGSGAALATIPVICGPTASGKSAIAMWLAQRRDVLVISADSRQVYRRFDVGTAKPSRDDLRRVVHRGVDVVEPTERFSAAHWVTLAEDAIRDAADAGKLPLVVGGTGFYISALFRPLWAEPPLDVRRREALQERLDPLATEELRRWCASLDPVRAQLGRAQLLRAIEVALLTGERLSDLHVAQARPGAYRASYLLVDPGTELPARVAARAAAMFDAGWPDEVRQLLEDVPADAPGWNATGYEVVRQYVRGELDQAGAMDRVVIETRQYAKRQRTWFRHQLGADRVHRLAPNATGWQETVDRWITDVEAQRAAEGQEDGGAERAR